MSGYERGLSTCWVPMGSSPPTGERISVPRGPLCRRAGDVASAAKSEAVRHYLGRESVPADYAVLVSGIDPSMLGWFHTGRSYWGGESYLMAMVVEVVKL